MLRLTDVKHSPLARPIPQLAVLALAAVAVVLLFGSTFSYLYGF